MHVHSKDLVLFTGHKFQDVEDCRQLGSLYLFAPGSGSKNTVFINQLLRARYCTSVN